MSPTRSICKSGLVAFFAFGVATALPLSDDATRRVSCTFESREEEHEDGEYAYGACDLGDGEVLYLEEGGLTEGLEFGDGIDATIQEIPDHMELSAPPVWMAEGKHLHRVITLHNVESAAAENDEALAGNPEAAASAPIPAKEMDLLMIRLKYADGKEPSRNEAQIWGGIFGDAVTPGVSDMYNKSSYGKLTVSKTASKVITVNMPGKWEKCPTSQLNSIFALAKSQKGVDASQFTFREIHTPAGNCGFCGIAPVGCGMHPNIPRKSACWTMMANNCDHFTRAHEFGHNLGLIHAGGYMASWKRWDSYGDCEAPQGSRSRCAKFTDFLAGSRYTMGVLPKSEVVDWKPDAPAKTLQALSSPIDSAASGTDGVAIDIPCYNCQPKIGSTKGAGHLWVSFRGDDGYSSLKLDAKYQNKVYVHLFRGRNPSTPRFGRQGAGSELWATLGEKEKWTGDASTGRTTVYVCKIDTADAGTAKVFVTQKAMTTAELEKSCDGSSPPPPPPGDMKLTFDFESSAKPGWTHGGSGLYKFTRKSGRTPSSGTGPSTGYPNKGFYYYAEASHPRKLGDRFSMSYDGSGCDKSKGYELSGVSFKYHMYGKTMGTLSVKDAAGKTVWSKNAQSGNLGNQWKDSGELALTSGFTFEYKRGFSWSGDAAIDSVVVTCKKGGKKLIERIMGELEATVAELKKAINDWKPTPR